jgi:hypothetical protein
MTTTATRLCRQAALAALFAAGTHCGTADSPIGARPDAGAEMREAAPPVDAGAPVEERREPPTVDASADIENHDDVVGPEDAGSHDVTFSHDVIVPEADSAGPVSHRFLSSTSHEGPIAIVGKDGALEWSYATGTPESNDAWFLPNGNVVAAVRTGVREVTPAKQIVWEYIAPSDAEVHAVQPLPGDLFLVGESHADGTSVIYEMDRAKKIAKTIPITGIGSGVHDQFREVRKTPQGTYITSQQKGGGKAMEFDAQGKLLRTFPCGRFVGIRLPDGNTLISCGDDHRVVEVDPQNAIVWEVKENDVPGNPLAFASGLQRLANGNTVICNWQGHIDGGTSPQVFEITRDKKVVWEVRDAKLGWISNIQILDPEAAVNGVSLR